MCHDNPLTSHLPEQMIRQSGLLHNNANWSRPILNNPSLVQQTWRDWVCYETTKRSVAFLQHVFTLALIDLSQGFDIDIPSRLLPYYLLHTSPNFLPSGIQSTSPMRRCAMARGDLSRVAYGANQGGSWHNPRATTPWWTTCPRQPYALCLSTQSFKPRSHHQPFLPVRPYSWNPPKAVRRLP